MAELAGSQRWELVREIFGGALERDPEDWAPFLRQACAGDRQLRTEVGSLLEAHRSGGDFLAEPAADEAAAAAFGDDDAVPQKGDERGLEGRRLGAYAIERCIGRGGMGTVYSAVRADSAFDKRVAIKLLKRDMDSAAVTRRFRAERQILAGLEHPNIARLVDGGTTGDGRPYLVMEYVEGLAIDRYCDHHKLPIPDRLALFRTVCAAVQFAHRNLVVHRDLKPSNILVTADGEPKLLDFGIAKILDPRRSSRTFAPTETVLRLMTPDYASPEQVLGTPVTTASDTYALGVLLYLLLAGRHPFAFNNRPPVEVLWAIRNRDPEPPSSTVRRPLDHRPTEIDGSGSAVDKNTPARSIAALRGSDPGGLRRGLSGDLDNIVLMALRKEPERRYASVDQFSEDLRNHLEGRPVLARGDSLGYRCGKFVRRHRLGVLAAAVFLAAILGFGIVMAMQRAEIASERDRLDEQRQRTEIERRRAERVTSFLVDLFEVSDPFSSKADAREVTARELLDRGAGRLSELEGEPEARAELSHTIGLVYRQMGLSDQATPLLEYALEARRALPGSDPAKIADSLDQQALLARERGDYVTAEDYFRQSLALRRSRFGERHRAVAESLSNLSGLAVDAGDFDGAERLQREALTIYRQRLGDEDATVASGLRQLAAIVQSQGDHDAAERLYLEALEIQLRLFGDQHAQVARTRYSLAELVLRRGDYRQAEVLYRRALATMRRSLGDEHVEVAFGIHSLAVVLAGQGDVETAERLYRQALAMLGKLRGPEHPDLVATLSGLGRVLLAKRDFSGAERSYRKGLEIRRQAFGEGNPYLAISYTGLGRVANEKGDYAAAERLLNQALEIGRRAFPGGHWRINVAESLLGDCRLRTGRYAEAEPLLLESYRALKSRRGERAVITQATLDRLVDLYQAWGRPEEAAKFRAERRRAS